MVAGTTEDNYHQVSVMGFQMKLVLKELVASCTCHIFVEWINIKWQIYTIDAFRNI